MKGRARPDFPESGEKNGGKGKIWLDWGAEAGMITRSFARAKHEANARGSSTPGKADFQGHKTKAEDNP